MADEQSTWLSFPAGFTAACVVILVLIWANAPPKDDSDSPDRRSGLSVHIDALTGCQYLSHSKGGLVQRTDSDGDHVGCRLGSRR